MIDYLYIRAWGKMLGSHEYYIKNQVEQAREDKAPQDVIYKRDKDWVRFSEVRNVQTKYQVNALVAIMEALNGIHDSELQDEEGSKGSGEDGSGGTSVSA
jgi:hypothetical protein